MLEDLITLCHDCHEAITSVIRKRRYELEQHDIDFEDEVKGGKYNVLAKEELHVDWHDAIDNKQWSQGQSPEQVGSLDKEDLRETSQDRGGLYGNGAS